MKSIIKAKQRADRIWTPLIFRSSYQPSQLSTTRYSASAWRAILVNWWSWEPLLPVFAASSSKVCVSKPNCEHGGRKTALKINLPVPIASKSPPEPLSLFFFPLSPFYSSGNDWRRKAFLQCASELSRASWDVWHRTAAGEQMQCMFLCRSLCRHPPSFHPGWLYWGEWSAETWV